MGKQATERRHCIDRCRYGNDITGAKRNADVLFEWIKQVHDGTRLCFDFGLEGTEEQEDDERISFRTKDSC